MRRADAEKATDHTESDDELGVVGIFRAVIGHGDYASMAKSKSRVDFILKRLYNRPYQGYMLER